MTSFDPKPLLTQQQQTQTLRNNNNKVRRSFLPYTVPKRTLSPTRLVLLFRGERSCLIPSKSARERPLAVYLLRGAFTSTTTTKSESPRSTPHLHFDKEFRRKPRPRIPVRASHLAQQILGPEALGQVFSADRESVLRYPSNILDSAEETI